MPKVTGYCLYSSFDSNVSDVRIITEQQNPCITYSMSFTHCNWVELTLESLKNHWVMPISFCLWNPVSYKHRNKFLLMSAKHGRWSHHLILFTKGTCLLKFQVDIWFVRAKLTSIALWLLSYEKNWANHGERQSVCWFQCSHFIPPESSRKPLVLWCFQGV